jgi:hypothetical protein
MLQGPVRERRGLIAESKKISIEGQIDRRNELIG